MEGGFCAGYAAEGVGVGSAACKKVVGLEGFEPPTHGLGNRCSILLSYRPTTGKPPLDGSLARRHKRSIARPIVSTRSAAREIWPRSN